jgi:RHS repeat-associated protein
VNPVSVNPSLGDDFPNLSWGNPLRKREYAFGTGTHGTLARETDFNYLHLTNTAYKNLNIADRPTSKIVSDGSSNFAQTTYEYDNYGHFTGGMQASGAIQHDSAFSTSFTTRGNLTATQRWRNPGNTWLSAFNEYDDAGSRLKSQDPNGNTTTFDYTDTWSGATCNVGSNTKAYLTLTTAPATNTSHRSKNTYYPCTGQVQMTQDENDILANRSGTTYTYDSMLRPSTVTQPDGGQTSYSYVDTSGSVSITSTQTINSSTNRVTVSNRDGLGREYKSQLTSDPDSADGTDTVDTTYDLLGRKSTVSNPHRSTSSTTDGITTYYYDALNRITFEIPPDGTATTNNVATTYGAQTTSPLCLTTTVTDQAGKSRMSCSDALGHMVEVIEYTSPTNYETDYSYDVLDNLLSVTQKGDNANNVRTRTFFYDSLSRLTSAANPESGTITYSYTNGTALCAGDISAVCSKTAPAPNQSSGTVTTTYTYDVLNRLTQRSYSDGVTPYDAWGYDQTNIIMGSHQFTINNSIGRLSWSVGGVVAPYNNDAMYAYSYDTMGRVVSFWNGVNDLGSRFDYAYNLDGSPKTLTYPSGRILTYTVKGAGRVTDIKDVANSVNYATGATYAPPGELAGMTNGFTSTFAGVTTTDSYNKRLQPITLSADTNGSGGHTVISRSYDFHLANGDNGVVYQIVNGLDSNRTQNFTYDNLNRITQANTTGSNWGETYTVDAWGNLTNRGPVSGKNTYEPLNASVNTNNQVIGLGYDIAGNLTSNGSSTYIYDARNQLINTGGYTYGYDANGERVKKMGGANPPGEIYLHGAGGETLAETQGNGTLLSEYIFFNGQRIARRDANGTVHYYFADHLGSASVITDASGTVQKEADYYPYGGEIAVSGSDANHYKFTGKERDETGLDEFGARYYSSAMGRFMTADWGAIPMAVPYAVLGNPQTLNLYSYVENNPATGTDPDGHAGDGDSSNSSDPKTDPEEVRKKKDNPLIGNAQATYALGQTLVTAVSKSTSNNTTDKNGNILATTTTTTTAYFQAGGDNAGQYLGTATETSTVPTIGGVASGIYGGSSTTVSQDLRGTIATLGASNVMQAQRMAAAYCTGGCGTARKFPGAVARDARNHPMKYVFAAGEVGLIFTPLPAGLAAIEGIHEVKASIDAGVAAGDLTWELLQK